MGEHTTHKQILDRLLEVEKKVDAITVEEDATHLELHQGIAELKMLADQNTARVQNLESIIVPWGEVLTDVAAVGRVGKIIVRSSVAVTTVAAALAAVVYLTKNGISDAAGSVADLFRGKK